MSTRLLWVPSSLTCDLYSTSCCLVFNNLLLHPQLLISWIHTVSCPPAVSSLLYKTNPRTSFHTPSSKNITLPLMSLMAENYLVIVIHNEREITCDFNIYFPGVITLKEVLTHCTYNKTGRQLNFLSYLPHPQSNKAPTSQRSVTLGKLSILLIPWKFKNESCRKLYLNEPPNPGHGQGTLVLTTLIFSSNYTTGQGR